MNENISESIEFVIEDRNNQRWKELEKKFSFLNLTLLLIRSPQRNKTIKYHCQAICGGLGDRLRGLLITYVFALLLNRQLIIEMHYPCDFTNFFQPNKYKWLTPADVKFQGNWLNIHAIDQNEDLMKQIGSTNFIEKWSKYDNIQIATNIDFFSAVFQNVHLKSHPIIQMFSKKISPEQANIQTLFPLFYEILLKPSNGVAQKLNQLLIDKKTKKLICTHLRIGRNPSNPRDYAFPYAKELPQQIINFIRKKRFLEVDPSLLLFVSSDSQNVTNSLTNQFLNRSFFVPGPVLQIDLPANNVNCYDGYAKVVMDFYLLSECSINILTNSGFSAFANKRRLNPYKNLYKYNSINNTIEQCLDLTTQTGWEPSNSISTKLYCPVQTEQRNITIIY